MSKVYIGDVGTVFDFDSDPNATGVDLTGYTLKVRFKKPSGDIVEKSGALKPASTTVVRYTTTTNDIDVAGTWEVQIKVTLGTNIWYGETSSFEVYEQFK